MREVFAVGLGTTCFARSHRAAGDLAGEAAAAAMADAGVTNAQIPAVYFGTGTTDAVVGTDAISVRLALRRLGLHRGATISVEDAGASATRAMHLGWQAVAAGAHEVALCLGAERLAAGGEDAGPTVSVRRHSEAARRYMSESGATAKHFARVAVKNQGNGARNPRAALGGEVDVTTILASEELAWPLTRLMCPPVADGAAAVIFASADAKRRVGARGVRVRASILVSEKADAGDAPVVSAGRAARLAYQAAGLGPEDIDCAELHDATAAAELMLYEQLQFAPQGQGPELIDSGFTALGGVLPVNTSGGLLSQGHLVGVSGIAQVCEVAWQLRREAGARQVARANVGLAQSGGPFKNGSCAVALTILSAA